MKNLTKAIVLGCGAALLAACTVDETSYDDNYSYYHSDITSGYNRDYQKPKHNKTNRGYTSSISPSVNYSSANAGGGYSSATPNAAVNNGGYASSNQPSTTQSAPPTSSGYTSN